MTDREQWARVQEIFHEALDRPEAERGSFLAEVCAGDAELEAGARSLLEAHAAPDLIASLDDESEGPRLYGLARDRIGPYRILRPLGEGGMGMVFLAVREEHDVTQTVALKILRLEFADSKLVDRFRAERRILARLEHPGIARLITAGATETGQPYFAMEFVEGTSLLEHCRANHCTLNDRLQLFLEICDAVEYAHQQLVVHRDLKPANVLVTEDGRPKLLDFGIAKLLDSDDPEMVATRTGWWFTPEYASPEQLRRQAVTTLSDIYSLGVILYELLSGARPHDLRGLSPLAMERRVATEAPLRPSERATDPVVARQLRGDIDTIVLKALSPEPARRYANVSELADDVRRFIARQPVRARPDRWSYRAARFAQRHRLAVSAAAVMMLSLVGGLAAVSWQAAVAANERDRAEQALDESRNVSAFLAELFQSADPTLAPGDTGAARAILRRGVAEVDRLAGQPLVQARMLDALGMVFLNLGEYERAYDFLTRSLSLRATHLDSLHPDFVESLRHSGRVLRAMSRYEDAERAYVRALELVRRSGRAVSPMAAAVLYDLGFLMPYLSRNDDAARYYQELLSLRRTMYGERDPSVAETLIPIAGTYRRRGDYAAAESLLREAVERHRRDVGPDDPRTGVAYFHLGDIIVVRGGDSSEAERLFREGIAVHRAATGARSLGPLHGMSSLAALLSARGRYAEAESLVREGLEINKSVFGSEGPAVAGATDGLAVELARQKRYGEALPIKRRGLELWRRAVGTEHAAVASSMHELAAMLIEHGDYAEAESLLTEVVAMRTRLYGAGAILVALTQSTLGDLLYRQGRHDEAERALLEALRDLKREQTDQHDDVRQVYSRLARVAAARGRQSDAERFRRLAARP